MKNFWSGKRVLVTGAHGFLGSHLCPLIHAEAQVFEPTHYEFDMTNATDVTAAFEWARPQIVIHLAADVGGIGYNQRFPADLFRSNMLMGVNVIDACKTFRVAKLVVIGTTCAYPANTPTPFKEDDLWNGYPEQTNAAYGIAKRALLTMCQAYRMQYNLNSIYLLPANLYGPGDKFDPEYSHVIPAMIRKFCDAIKDDSPSVTLWGDGTAEREFLYVDDCARGIVLATERYNSHEPCNLGTGQGISIHSLAIMVKELTGYKGKIEWDTSRPNGQMRRVLDTSRAAGFGFVAETRLAVGLEATIKWYKQHGHD